MYMAKTEMEENLLIEMTKFPRRKIDYLVWKKVCSKWTDLNREIIGNLLLKQKYPFYYFELVASKMVIAYDEGICLTDLERLD